MRARGRSIWQDSKSGKWKYQVRVPRYGQKPLVLQRTASTKRDAERLADQLFLELDAARVIHRPLKFAELVHNYLKLKEPYVRPTTLANNSYLLSKYLLPTLGNRLVERITSAELQNILTEMRPGLSTATVNKIRSVANGVFETALDHRQIEFNPLTPVKKLANLPEEVTQVCEPWDLEETRAVLGAFADTDLDFFVHATLTLGLRKGEALGLRWADLNFEGGYLDVRRSRGSARTLDEKGKIMFKNQVGELKTKASRRRLGMTNLLLISAMRERDKLESLGKVPLPDQYVTTSRKGTPIAEKELYRIYNGVLAQSGLRRIRIHDTRHTAAVLALEAEIDLYKVSFGLGHGSQEITRRIYAPRVPALSIHFAETLANHIGGDPIRALGANSGGGVIV